MASIVSKSCCEYLQHKDCLAKTHPERINAWLASIDKTLYENILQSEKSKMTLPLSFESSAQKLNFYSLLHLLNFGSGYRVELKAANGLGAFNNIIRLLMAAHISGHPLDYTWMQSITPQDVAGLMHLDLYIEESIEHNPALFQVRASPITPLIDKIVTVLHETAETIRRLGGHTYLIDFITTCCTEADNVDSLLCKLARIPTLDDAYATSSGERVYIYKKMQVMLSELLRNGLTVPYLTQEKLTIFSDNVVPTQVHAYKQASELRANDGRMLQHFKLISCPSADSALQHGLQLTPEQVLGLRAASIVICEEIVQVASERYAWIGNAVDLDNYLWKVAKEKHLRQLPRYVDRNTSFF